MNQLTFQRPDNHWDRAFPQLLLEWTRILILLVIYFDGKMKEAHQGVLQVYIMEISGVVLSLAITRFIVSDVSLKYDWHILGWTRMSRIEDGMSTDVDANWTCRNTLESFIWLWKCRLFHCTKRLQLEIFKVSLYHPALQYASTVFTVSYAVD